MGRIHANIITVEKAISVAYSGRVYVALGTEHAMRMRYIFIYGLPSSTVFFHIISYTARLITICVFRVYL